MKPDSVFTVEKILVVTENITTDILMILMVMLSLYYLQVFREQRWDGQQCTFKPKMNYRSLASIFDYFTYRHLQYPSRMFVSR